MLKIMGSSPIPGNAGRFPDFLDFWDPETPNIFRRFRSPVAAPAELLPGKCPYFVQLFLGFHQNLSKTLVFIRQSPPFYENPVSSVRPSETQTGRFCVCTHTPGELLDFRLLDFPFFFLGGVEFLICKRFNFPEPFRLVRKTLLIRSLLISEDLVRQKSSHEPKCSENQSFCPNSGGRFSGGLLDFRLLDFPAPARGVYGRSLRFYFPPTVRRKPKLAWGQAGLGTSQSEPTSDQAGLGTSHPTSEVSPD